MPAEVAVGAGAGAEAEDPQQLVRLLVQWVWVDTWKLQLPPLKVSSNWRGNGNSAPLHSKSGQSYGTLVRIYEVLLSRWHKL
jgi:hypothetical protein